MKSIHIQYSMLVAAIALLLMSLVEPRFTAERPTSSVAAASSKPVKYTFSSTISVLLSHNELRSKHYAAMAFYGVARHGGSMVGRLTHPDNDSNGCSIFEGNKPFKSTTSHPTILLVDNGDCFFAQKVWNGQEAGAAAVLVANMKEEPLAAVNMTSRKAQGFVEKVGIPSALINGWLGHALKVALKRGEVIIRMDWSPVPKQPVKYEMWTNTEADEQIGFLKEFKKHAQILEKVGSAQFSPHYITWYCPNSDQCKTQCIKQGRYCATNSEHGQGRDVVISNLRQLCVHKVAAESNAPGLWWDFVSDFHMKCSMNESSNVCAHQVIKALGLPLDQVNQCIGDPNEDNKNEILENERDQQIGHGSRGDITILPTMVIDNAKHEGDLDGSAVLKTICAGINDIDITVRAICSALTEAGESDDSAGSGGGFGLTHVAGIIVAIAVIWAVHYGYAKMKQGKPSEEKSVEKPQDEENKNQVRPNV